ncbi:hypothetical protein T09_12877, partial [Trichinella sp. T9]
LALFLFYFSTSVPRICRCMKIRIHWLAAFGGFITS